MTKLISVAGGDRAAVEALAGQLAGWLQARGVQLVRFALPTRGPVGALIRLEAQSRLRLDPASLALLWTADRLDLLSREGGILAQLGAEMTVLCTHYAWWEAGPCEGSEAISTYAQEQFVGCEDQLGDCVGAKSTRLAMTKPELSPEAGSSVDPDWLERIHARCLRPDLALWVDGERTLDRWQHEVAALLWPGEVGI